MTMNFLEEAINSYLQGDANSAIKLLNAYIDQYKGNPPSGQAYYYLGLANMDIGKDTEAGQFFNKAIEKEPGKGAYHYQLGIIYSKLMLFTQAIEHLKQTIAQNPEHVHAHMVLGKIYFKNGDLDTAANQFKAVTRISPNFADGFYELGNCLYYMGDEENSLNAYLKACELDEKHADAHIKLGRIYADQKKYDEASEHLSKAYDLGTNDPLFLSNFALTLISFKQKERARLIVEKIEAINPNLPELAQLKEMVS